MRKYSNDIIPQIVDLGDRRYEFCFNHSTEQMEDHTSYVCDIVVVKGVPDRDNIIIALIQDGKTEEEANNIIENANLTW
jgi:hypothetical protein